MKSVPPRRSGWVRLVAIVDFGLLIRQGNRQSAFRNRQSVTHPLPLGGTDLIIALRSNQSVKLGTWNLELETLFTRKDRFPLVDVSVQSFFRVLSLEKLLLQFALQGQR